ncbi:MAG: 4-alpha-glucanotransferase, partial [Flavisolibacter sp.]
EEENFSERIAEYLKKALREAKLNSNWTSPNETYESTCVDFALALINKINPFHESFSKFYNKLVDHGIVNSLSQLILKFTCPGVPDVYQGCELWDFSLVDPDNRRAVDYEKRNEWLKEIQNQSVESLWQERISGKIKLWLTQLLFKLRRQQPELFTIGEYIPLKVEGEYKDHIIAFARKQVQNIFVVAVPLHTATICREQSVQVNQIDWKNTKISLPENAGSSWQQIFHAEKEEYKNGFLVSQVFKGCPFAVLKGQQVNNERGAGILLHISSLPSAFGIGDMGPEALAFADFLNRSRQKYWQLLPINPTEGGQGHSPYSSISSRAGNILLISPETLVAEGLLDIADLQSFIIPHNGKTDYEEATRIKDDLFEKAWTAWKQRDNDSGFDSFVQKEKEWLDDFALYALLKQMNGGKPWYEWEKDFKFRDEKALHSLLKENEAALQKIKWLQYIFSKQWHGLKNYCNHLGIQLIGDLPFYVSYDSADVWAHREIFALDEEGNKTGMAGVPPDAFSADGQLWGMPVFKWEVLKETNYQWWVERLRKNRELFDMIRLDHFRAFSAYWNVPSGETTARKGTWVPGPASDFFRAVQNQLGDLPFVAEDLGEIDQPVYALRDEFNLPGMKVLQFAFGGDMPKSIHIPHNYDENFIVYTGTHDNNTIRGWYRTEASEENHLAMERYLGRPLSSAEIPIVMARMAYSSVARIAILPLQDVLSLDESARMNTPASGENNWGWRLVPGQVTGMAEENLRNWTRMYNRE